MRACYAPRKFPQGSVCPRVPQVLRPSRIVEALPMAGAKICATGLHNRSAAYPLLYVPRTHAATRPGCLCIHAAQTRADRRTMGISRKSVCPRVGRSQCLLADCEARSKPIIIIFAFYSLFVKLFFVRLPDLLFRSSVRRRSLAQFPGTAGLRTSILGDSFKTILGSTVSRQRISVLPLLSRLPIFLLFTGGRLGRTQDRVLEQELYLLIQ